ncbi:MAG TPA: hypothetical protein VM324_04070 [Egibacteraceae bacterium]|nr:hypothetical protein [Egibacteraceae bacterium]
MSGKAAAEPAAAPPAPRASGQRPHRRPLRRVAAVRGLLRGHWQLAAVLGAFLATAALLPTLAPVAISDDWAYARSVEILLADRRLQILDVASASALFQILWGAPFGALTDNTFGALRLATVVFVALSGWAFYGLCRQLGLARPSSALGSALYLFNPVGFALAYTFMTDPYFTGLLVFAAYLYARGLRDDPRATRFLWAGSVAATLACLQRSTGVLIPLAVAAFFVLTGRARPDRHGALAVARVAAVPLLSTAAFFVIASYTGGVASAQAAFMRAALGAGWGDTALVAGRLAFIQVMYAGFFALPAMAAAAGRIPRLVSRLTARGWTVVALGLLLLFGGLTSFGNGRLMPYVGQFFNRAGTGPADLVGGRPEAFGRIWAAALTTACAYAALLLTVSLVGTLGKRVRRADVAGLVFALLLVQAVAAVLPSLSVIESFVSFDRYLLPLLPLAVGLALWSVQGVQPRLVVAWVLTGCLAVYSAVGTRDLLVFQSTVWELAERLTDEGVPPTKIDAGYAWDGYHVHDPSARDMKPRTRRGPWWTQTLAPATDSTYVVASHREPGYEPVERVGYSSMLHRGPVHLYVLRREDRSR